MATNTYSQCSQACPHNVGTTERWLSSVAAGALISYGFKKDPLVGMAMSVLAGGLIFRAVSGECSLYRSLSLSTA